MAHLDELPPDLVTELRVSAAHPLSGGDSANAFRLDTPDGPLFAKTMSYAPEGVLPVEAAALEALRAVAPDEVRIPAVRHVSEDAAADGGNRIDQRVTDYVADFEQFVDGKAQRNPTSGHGGATCSTISLNNITIHGNDPLTQGR